MNKLQVKEKICQSLGFTNEELEKVDNPQFKKLISTISKLDDEQADAILVSLKQFYTKEKQMKAVDAIKAQSELWCLLNNPDNAEAIYNFCTQEEIEPDMHRKCSSENLSMAEYVYKYKPTEFYFYLNEVKK